AVASAAAHEPDFPATGPRRAEWVGLQGDPVPISAGHLDDRLEAHGPDDRRGWDSGHGDRRSVAVGDVHSVDDTQEGLGAAAHDARRGALRRIQLRRDDELTRSEKARECAQRKDLSFTYDERSPGSVDPL